MTPVPEKKATQPPITGRPVHPGRQVRPPLYWRRWTFLASALFNLLFALFSLSGIRFSYAAIHSHPTLLGRFIQLLFWSALFVAMLADACIAAGWLEQYYHRLLDVILACNMFCFGLIATAELLVSLMLHAGFSEPLIAWLLVIPYQFLTVRSAHESPPPGRLRWTVHWLMPRSLASLAQLQPAAARIATRVRRAVQAFRDEPFREPPHEQQ